MSTSKLADYLHVLPTGDAVALVRGLDLGPETMVWDDHLSVGPIPAKLSPVNLAHRRCLFGEVVGWGPYRERRKAMAARDAELARYRDYGEVVFWFGPGLDDQLALLQALDPFAIRGGQGTRLTLIPFRPTGDDARPRDVADHSPGELRALFERRRDLDLDACRLGRRAWDALRSGDPAMVHVLLGTDSSALPDLAPALHRWLEELPDLATGLSRTEAAVLAALGDDQRSAAALLGAVREREAVPFQTAAILDVVLADLSAGSTPLLSISGEIPVAVPGRAFAGDGRTVNVTVAGRSVREGATSWSARDLPGRWLGGYQIGEGTKAWRWDADRAEVRDAGAI